MRDFWKAYLRGKLPAFGLFVLCCAVFGVTFRLYELPPMAVLYPALICLALWLCYTLVLAAKAARKHKTLSSLTEAFTLEMLPDPDTVDDADYRRVIALLQEVRRVRESEA
ncbi:MAG: sensor histidine kinase, partial [Oscillospiraceae bacterium]|nr:sensor histidine kinase [Oscillospiraceae bacterium]